MYSAETIEPDVSQDILVRALPQSKNVSVSVTFPKYSGRPPLSRLYDDGVYRGWLKLSYWEDLSDKYPKGYIKGYYRGNVNRTNIN